MTLPMDWTEWRAEWSAWQRDHGEDLTPTRRGFPGKNFMADEVLGTWIIRGTLTELSEVTFLDRRGIGITYEDAAGERASGGVVHSFAELDEALGL